MQALSKLTTTIHEQSQHQTKAGRFLPIDMTRLAVGQIAMVCSEIGNWLIYTVILLLPLFLVVCIIHKSSSTSPQCQGYRRGFYMPMTAPHDSNKNDNNYTAT
jgi:hypothetical protein